MDPPPIPQVPDPLAPTVDHLSARSNGRAGFGVDGLARQARLASIDSEWLPRGRAARTRRRGLSGG